LVILLSVIRIAGERRLMAGEHLLEELGRFEGDAEILQAWRDGMAPEPALLVSE
jgi:hypothetical protein